MQPPPRIKTRMWCCALVSRLALRPSEGGLAAGAWGKLAQTRGDEEHGYIHDKATCDSD